MRSEHDGLISFVIVAVVILALFIFDQPPYIPPADKERS